jgi:SRSO17 transposase
VSAAVAGQAPAPGHVHTVLIRRSTGTPTEVEFFLAHAPAGTPVPELIDAAGMHWKIEENNEHGKDLLGLTSYQVRKWTPWHRHVTIAMLAPAFLAVTRAALPADADEAGVEGKDRLLLEASAG